MTEFESPQVHSTACMFVQDFISINYYASYRPVQFKADVDLEIYKAPETELLLFGASTETTLGGLADCNSRISLFLGDHLDITRENVLEGWAAAHNVRMRVVAWARYS